MTFSEGGGWTSTYEMLTRLVKRNLDEYKQIVYAFLWIFFVTPSPSEKILLWNLSQRKVLDTALTHSNHILDAYGQGWAFKEFLPLHVIVAQTSL